MFEILTHIFDVSTTIQPYNVRDFNPHFELIMFVIQAQNFDISTKIRDILNKRFKLFTNILEIQSKILDILPKFRYFDSKFCQTFEKILDKISRISFKINTKRLKISGHIDKNKITHSETAPPPLLYQPKITKYYQPQESSKILILSTIKFKNCIKHTIYHRQNVKKQHKTSIMATKQTFEIDKKSQK